jgi:hypothetical protein
MTTRNWGHAHARRYMKCTIYPEEDEDFDYFGWVSGTLVREKKFPYSGPKVIQTKCISAVNYTHLRRGNILCQVSRSCFRFCSNEIPCYCVIRIDGSPR